MIAMAAWAWDYEPEADALLAHGAFRETVRIAAGGAAHHSVVNCGEAATAAYAEALCATGVRSVWTRFASAVLLYLDALAVAPISAENDAAARARRELRAIVEENADLFVHASPPAPGEFLTR